MSFIKNIDKSQVLTLKDEVSYQKGQVVSKTLAQNDALSVTLFAFDKDEEISTHESGGDDERLYGQAESAQYLGDVDALAAGDERIALGAVGFTHA